MNRLGVVGVVVLLGSASAGGQIADVPGAWLGVWKLNPQRSTFDTRAPVIVQAQTLKIEATGGTLILKGDTILLDGRRVSEVAQVKLNGETTTGPGGLEAVFKALDRESFEIVVTTKDASLWGATGVNRFVFSSDGRSLVETKTQMRRGTDAGQGRPSVPDVGAVRTVLIFERQE